MREKFLNFIIALVGVIAGAAVAYLIIVNPFAKNETSISGTGIIRNTYTGDYSKVVVDNSGISTAVKKVYDAVVMVQNYKSGKLQSDDLMATDRGYGCWYVLDPNNTVKFNLYNDEMPLFISAIPQLLDLDEAQDLDRRKQMQQLLKILIQKLPRDKNGDLIFDVDEARDIHNNAACNGRQSSALQFPYT